MSFISLSKLLIEFFYNDDKNMACFFILMYSTNLVVINNSIMNFPNCMKS